MGCEKREGEDIESNSVVFSLLRSLTRYSHSFSTLTPLFSATVLPAKIVWLQGRQVGTASYKLQVTWIRGIAYYSNKHVRFINTPVKLCPARITTLLSLPQNQISTTKVVGCASEDRSVASRVAMLYNN